MAVLLAATCPLYAEGESAQVKPLQVFIRFTAAVAVVVVVLLFVSAHCLAVSRKWKMGVHIRVFLK